MSTMYRLKAYFGMVPAEDMDAYLENDDDPGYYEEPRPSYPQPRTESFAERSGAAQQHVADRYRIDEVSRSTSVSVPSQAPAATISGTSSRLGSVRPPAVHGSLAMESAARAEPAVPSFMPPLPVASSESSEAIKLPLSRITTVHPRSYKEARTIGERYREGIPVIINLTELDTAAAKRLVDFSAGLAFALRGSIDKVTSRVFLLSPAGVEVSAEDKRKLAESGFFRQD